MKIQKLITADSRLDFDTEVNAALNKGMVVVPGTLQIAVSVAAVAPYSSSAGHTSISKVSHFACVVEDQIEGAAP